MSRPERLDRNLREDFILREHEALQEKMSRSAPDLWRIETIVPLAIAALYAWLAKDGGQVGDIFNWLLGIPVGLVLFGVCRQELRYRYIDVVEDYLIRMEKAVYGERDDIKGWENHWKSRGSKGNRHTRRAVWAILLVATLLIAANGSSLYQRKDASLKVNGQVSTLDELGKAHSPKAAENTANAVNSVPVPDL